MTIDDGTPLNALPTIITGPGDYVTRDGGRVTIREIHPAPQGSATAFTAKGSNWTTYRGTYRSRGHDIWHVSGRHKAVGLSARDIIGPYGRAAEAAGKEQGAST